MHRSPFRCWRFTRRLLGIVAAVVLIPALALAQANGKLQIHHMKIGQGDGILLISPLGQTALFDSGVWTNCDYIKSYIQGLGITTVNYHFASHYHADHIGCIDDLAAIGITIGTAGYDRGYSYSSATYTNYVNTLGAKRQTMTKNQVVTLDAGSANPVYIKCVDLNGAGVYSPTGSDENAKSMVMKVSYGAFDEVIAGDLTGDGSTDVETTIGPMVGDVEVYKVHHHGSRYSTNVNWLNAITAEVAVIQVGNNSYGHPTADALGRMHAKGIKTYWTEQGSGASPNGTYDTVANGTVLVQADPGAGATYTVSGPGFSHNYTNGGGTPPPPPITETLVATSVTMLKGSITVGDVTRLAANDGSRMSISAGVESGKYVTDWYGSVTLGHPPLNLTVTYDGNYTVTRTQSLYLWNWATSAWDLKTSGSVGTSDVTMTWSTGSAPTDYVSPTREVRLRLRTNTRNSSFTCRGDYMAFTYDYAQGTAPMLIASAVEPEREAAPAFIEQPLAVLGRVETRPRSEGVELLWTTDRDAHVDGFNVYREMATGERTFVGNEAILDLRGTEVVFRFADPEGPADGVYWLGARGCAGPETLIGPIRVAAGDVLASRPLWAAPNPVRNGTAFGFSLARAGDAALELFDVSGRRLATLHRGRLAAGHHRVAWDGRSQLGERVAPGTYFARLEADGGTQFLRVVVTGR